MKKQKITKNKPDQIYKGIAYACMASVAFTVMNGFARALEGIHNVVEISFYRNLICLLPCLAYILLSRKHELFHSTMPFLLGFRVLVGAVGLICTLAAVQYLPLSDATVLFFTSTLLIPVMAHFYLKEHIGPMRWTAVFVGLAGVVLVAQPSGDVSMIGVALALGAAVVHATIQVLLRAMKSENPFTITFYFFLGGVVVPGLFMPFVATVPQIENLPLLLGVGVAGGMGQYFLTRAFQMAPASLLGPFSFTGLLWATGLDIIFWNYIPGWPVYLGALVIISSNLFILYRERLKKRR